MKEATAILSDSSLTLITVNSPSVLNFSQWSEIWWTHLKPTETCSEVRHAYESMFYGRICSLPPKAQTWKGISFVFFHSVHCRHTHTHKLHQGWQESCAFTKEKYSCEQQRWKQLSEEYKGNERNACLNAWTYAHVCCVFINGERPFWVTFVISVSTKNSKYLHIVYVLKKHTHTKGRLGDSGG